MWLLIIGILLLLLGATLQSYCAVGLKHPTASPQIVYSRVGTFLQIGWVVFFITGTTLLFFVHWIGGIAAIVLYWFVLPLLITPSMRKWMLGKEANKESKRRDEASGQGLGSFDEMLSELEGFAKQREELGIEDDNYILITKNISKYYMELINNYRDKFEDQITLLLTTGILDAQQYIFVEKSIDISEIHETAKNSVNKPLPLVSFILALGIIMFKVDSPEFTVLEIADAWESQRERVEEEVSSILESYNRDSIIAEVTKTFMDLPKFSPLRKQLGLLE